MPRLQRPWDLTDPWGQSILSGQRGREVHRQGQSGLWDQQGQRTPWGQRGQSDLWGLTDLTGRWVQATPQARTDPWDQLGLPIPSGQSGQMRHDHQRRRPRHRIQTA